MTEGFQRFLVDVDSTTTPQLVQRLASDGLVTFRGVEGRDALLGLGRRFGEIQPHSHGDADGVTFITPRAEIRGPSSTGFSSLPLALHTDGSSLARPPALVLVSCVTAAVTGGATVLADGAAAHRDLLRTAPAALAALSAPGGARFGADGALGGAIYSVLPGTDRLHVRFRSDTDVWFAEETSRALALFLSVLRTRTYSFVLGPDEGYILQNGRWLHGRTAFAGRRSMLRVLCEPSSPALAFGFRPQLARAAFDALPGRRVR